MINLRRTFTSSLGRHVFLLERDESTLVRRTTLETAKTRSLRASQTTGNFRMIAYTFRACTCFFHAFECTSTKICRVRV